MAYDRAKLSKMTKSQLALMHVANGGLMGYATYMKWTKEELINEILYHAN
jgi:hypothetical protein